MDLEGDVAAVKSSAHLMGLKDELFQLQRRKEYWNILVVCSDGRLEMNSLCLGLVFPQLTDHAVAILPEHSVTEVEDLVRGCLRAVSYPRPGERRKTWDDPSLLLDTGPDQEVEMQEAESQFQQPEAEGPWKENKYSQYLATRVPETIAPEVITPEVITPEVITPDPLDFQPDLTNIDQDSQVPNRLQPVENVVSQGSQTDPSSGPKSPTKARTGEAVKKRRNPLFVDAPQTSGYVGAGGDSSLHLDVKPNLKENAIQHYTTFKAYRVVQPDSTPASPFTSEYADPDSHASKAVPYPERPFFPERHAPAAVPNSGRHAPAAPAPSPERPAPTKVSQKRVLAQSLQELAEQLGVIRACSVRLPRLCFTRRPRLPATKKKKMNRVSDGKGLNIKAKRLKRRCNMCEYCKVPECRTCVNCLDMKKYGGPQRMKQACKMRPMCPYKTTEPRPRKIRRTC